MTDIEIRPRGRWKLSRPCYNKPHRCPGWAGSGWRFAHVDHCTGGYITFGMSRAELAALDFTSDEWARYPRPFALGQCTRCDVVVLPFWTRKLSLVWWSRELRDGLRSWLWWRRAAVMDWWSDRREAKR